MIHAALDTAEDFLLASWQVALGMEAGVDNVVHVQVQTVDLNPMGIGLTPVRLCDWQRVAMRDQMTQDL